jgi:hypothetical protein
MTARLPEGWKATLSALFAYRNKMFHHGFEWPMTERAAFAETMRKQRWPADWFLGGTSDREPWIFYLSPAFIDRCLQLADGVLAAFGNFIRDHMEKPSVPSD